MLDITLCNSNRTEEFTLIDDPTLVQMVLGTVVDEREYYLESCRLLSKGGVT